MLAAFRWSTHIHSKHVGEPIEYSRCLPLPCFNKLFFDSEKFVIVLFVTKQYQPFCKDNRYALMKLPCSGLLPGIEVGLCYLRKWRKANHFFFILKQAQSM